MSDREKITEALLFLLRQQTKRCCDKVPIGGLPSIYPAHHEDDCQVADLIRHVRGTPLAPASLRVLVRMLSDSIESNPGTRSGVPVLKGTWFPASRTLAQIADGDSVDELAENFDLDKGVIVSFLHGLAKLLDAPITDAKLPSEDEPTPAEPQCVVEAKGLVSDWKSSNWLPSDPSRRIGILEKLLDHVRKQAAEIERLNRFIEKAIPPADPDMVEESHAAMERGESKTGTELLNEIRSRQPEPKDPNHDLVTIQDDDGDDYCYLQPSIDEDNAIYFFNDDFGMDLSRRQARFVARQLQCFAETGHLASEQRWIPEADPETVKQALAEHARGESITSSEFIEEIQSREPEPDATKEPQCVCSLHGGLIDVPERAITIADGLVVNGAIRDGKHVCHECCELIVRGYWPMSKQTSQEPQCVVDAAKLIDILLSRDYAPDTVTLLKRLRAHVGEQAAEIERLRNDVQEKTSKILGMQIAIDLLEGNAPPERDVDTVEEACPVDAAKALVKGRISRRLTPDTCRIIADLIVHTWRQKLDLEASDLLCSIYESRLPKAEEPPTEVVGTVEEAS